MANVPRGAPKGKKSKEVFEDITVDDLTVTAGAITTVTATTVNASKINDADADTLKIFGEVTSRAAADNSMYVPVAASKNHERLYKIAGKVTANDGGYFDALYVNAATTTTATGGEVRAIEGKATVLANMDAGAIATGVYAKVNVSGASAEVAKAIGVDVLLEEEDSGTVTEGTGIRVQGGAGVVTYGLDVSGVYDKAAVKLKVVDGNAAVSIANLETAFGTDDAKDGLIGLYIDNSDVVHLVLANGGKYKTVQLTSVDS